MTFVVGQQVTVASNLTIGMRDGVFVNSDMVALAGTTQTVGEVGEVQNTYTLTSSPYLWAGTMFSEGGAVVEAPEEPEVVEDPFKFPVGTIVRVRENLEEIFGEDINANFGPGYAGIMDSERGKTGAVRALYDFDGYTGISIEGVLYTWVEDALEVIKTVEEVESEKQEVLSNYQTNCIYRVYYTNNGETTHRLSKIKATIDGKVEVTTLSDMSTKRYEPLEFLAKVEDSSIRVQRMERNS